jgi:hypothetical protein
MSFENQVILIGTIIGIVVVLGGAVILKFAVRWLRRKIERERQ